MAAYSRYTIHGRQPNSRPAAPIKLGIGKRNIRIDANTPADEYGRQVAAAFDEITKDLVRYFNQLEDGLPEDMLSAMEPTMELADYYCPVDTGKMVGSRYLAVEKFRSGVRVEAGYAYGGNPDYAVIVHERTDFKHAAPTRAKWFQSALDEDYFNIVQRLTENVKRRSGLAGG